MKRVLITGGSGFIGTNLIEFLSNKNYRLMNIDISTPKISTHKKYLRKCNILDFKDLQQAFKEYQPDYVIHLAARADVEGESLEDYKVNTIGTENLLKAIKSVNSVKRVIITSTQFVNQYNGLPKDDEDYAPHTVYGESKVITEQLTRQANLNCSWTIIRPTNIWGPWHWRYPFEFWKIIAMGLYLHPKNQRVIRSYGYVGNVCWQINKILEIDRELINGKVLYVGDKPIDIIDWVNLFSLYQTGKKVREVNKNFLKIVALIGDIFKLFNVNFPLTSSRLKSMTTSNDDIPINKTFNILGTPPYSIEDGVKETILWLQKFHPGLVKQKIDPKFISY